MTALVAAARKYLGVRFSHRGRRVDRLDCVGLVWRAYLDCGVVLECPEDYGREPDAQRFGEAIRSALGPPVDRLAVGDVVTLRTESHPHHIAIVGDYPESGFSLVHASGDHGRVVEHRLSDDYLERVVTIHRRPV